MKRIVYASIITFLAACSNSSTTNDEKIKEDNIAVVEKYVQAVQSKDIKTLSDLLSDDYIGYGPGFSDSIDKKSAIENFQNLADNLYDKITYARSLNIAAEVKDGPRPGNYVSNWAHLTITYKDGRGPVNLYANTAYRIENGKITNTRTIYDEADAERQLSIGNGQ
jgi:ketosteroid isomerase-like protein